MVSSLRMGGLGRLMARIRISELRKREFLQRAALNRLMSNDSVEISPLSVRFLAIDNYDF